jgi:ubiquinone/menaquinone biosynthesis C-methylase UbiE
MKDFEKLERLHSNTIAKRYNFDYHGSIIMKSHDEDFVLYVAENYQKRDRVLDLGCGPASMWPLWEKYLKEPRLLIGVDISEGMIKECKRLFPKGDFRVGSVLELPLESGSIDLIIAASVLHHIPDDHLRGALEEMHRVLDEHGTIVGREPVLKGRLGEDSGWLSGALMSFRHLVFRLTHTREYPEPAVGDHHHGYVPEDFVDILKGFFSPKGLNFKYPVSSYVVRCNHPLVKKTVDILDNAISHRGGHEFFYSATKNFCDAADVTHCVEQEIKANNSPFENKEQFLALLAQAAELLEKELCKQEE